MSLPVVKRIEQVVVLRSRSGSWVADVGVPAKEAPSRLSRFARQPPPGGESPRWSCGIFCLLTRRGSEIRITDLAETLA